eukprot:scaffold74423_cov27-Tisochrysis_lutea.AAC.8
MVGAGSLVAKVAACARDEGSWVGCAGNDATTPEGQGAVGLSAARHGVASGGNQIMPSAA